ncbi:choice-of-anchor D domain-containing protein [uncultured Polaribacter sp.]|uniref:choice-of-anchor D domain-containing protein n=1 Tax=uncultured Polaribacter sp. TaxID=174711 RepID=UPI0026240EDA|nr:choice-of-anchor D domain-containing protein [uncultured Polaribacter sp.]
MKKLALIVCLLLSNILFSQIPTYYDDVNLNLTGTSLRDELATKVINTHTTFLSYGWTVIQQTDLDPNDNTKVLLIYGSNDADGNHITDRTRNVNSNGGNAGTDWNREHTYPRSLGNPNLGTSGPGADVHHLRASDVIQNSNRGNLKFITGTGAAGVTGAGWYPGDEWKGDVARMMMYMYLRYGTRCLPSGVAIGTTNTIDANMIDLLLDWNAQDPVSQYETNRNNILETAQGNRNPFIDNPAFATEIWGGTAAEDKFSGASINQEINILGNSVSIISGATSTSPANDTNFGNVDTASGTVVKTFTIQNTGGATLTLAANPSISGGNAADFSITNNPSLTLSPGASTTFEITFDPTADGVRTTTVTILSDDADEATYNFNISGAGITSSGSGLPACGTELFISEYIEGSSNNKFLEIYNPTDAAINLSSYDLVSYVNGSATVSNTLPLSGTIAAQGTYVIGNTQETLTVVPDLSTGNGVMQFNGNDVVALRNSGVIIDVIGQIGANPGTSWSGTCGALEVTLIRNPDVISGDTDGTNSFTTDTEWSCLPIDDVSDLGSHTINCTNATFPEIDVVGNSASIPSGSASTSLVNDTDFGLVDTTSGTIVKTFTIENTGTAALTLSGNPTISGGNASDFSITSNPSLSVATSSSTSFQVTFNPSADGIRTTTITILNDDSDEGTYTFTISGEGTTNSSVACGTELFISEYIEGSSQNKFLEIYNPTNASVDLSNYEIVTYVNGATSVSETQTLSGTIASESTFVIENSAEDLGVTADLSVTGGVMEFSGNDVVALRKSGVLIDVIGQIGVDLVTSWPGTCGTQGVSLVRIDTVGAGDTNGTDSFTTDTEWSCTTINNVSNLGSHTLTCINGPEIILQGNSLDIADGTVTTSGANNTFFGSANVSTGAIVKTFTILNTGTSTLTLSQNPTISGANSSDFSVTSNANLSIPSGSSTTFQITFNPSNSGARNALVTILSDDADEGTFTFAIQGNGATGPIPCAIISGVTLFSQNFEIVPPIPELTYTSVGTAISLGSGSLFPVDNLFSEGSRGLQVRNATAVVEFATFDSTIASNLELSLKLASFAGTSGNGADTGDNVKILVSTDNGSTYSEEVTINGNNNARWSFTSGTAEASVLYDGDNTTTIFAPSGGGNRTTDGYSTIKVSSLPQSPTLKVKIEIRNNSTNELWIIDDVRITGDVESLATWNGAWTGVTPAENVKIIVNSDLDMTALPSIDACECEINAGATVTIPSDKYLRVQNNILNNGTIIVEDGGNLVQVSDISSIAGTGNFIANRNTQNLQSRFVYTYWASPLVNSTLAQIAADAGAYYSFIASTQSWSAANASTNMTPGVGYIAQGPRTGVSYPGSYSVQFSGSPFNNGVINVPLNLGEAVFNGATDNWNLVGNPYPSAIDASLFMSSNPEISGTIYFWTHNTDASTTTNFTQDDYVSWNGTGSTANCAGCIAPTGAIASGQGFFAQALNPSATITFNNSMRLGQGNTNFYKSENQKEDKIWLNLSGDNAFNQILIGYLKEATDGVDRLYDGEKLDGGTNANFYSLIDDKRFVIQGKSELKELDEIPLGFTTSGSGEFTISIDHLEGVKDYDITLVDNLLNVNHNLRDNDYTFSITEKGTFNNRFVLNIKKSAKVVLSSEDLVLDTLLEIENNKNSLVISTSNTSLMKSVVVYNILGKEIMNHKQVSSKIKLASNKLKSNAIYILKTSLISGEVIINKIIKN